MNYIIIVFVFLIAACSKPIYTQKDSKQLSDNTTKIIAISDNVSVTEIILVDDPVVDKLYNPEFPDLDKNLSVKS